MPRSRDQEANHRYDPAIRAAISDEFHRRTGQIISVEMNEVGLYTLAFGDPAIPETPTDDDDPWEFKSLKSAKKARAEGRTNVLPREDWNGDYAPIELLRRLLTLEAFLKISPGTPISTSTIPT